MTAGRERAAQRDRDTAGRPSQSTIDLG